MPQLTGGAWGGNTSQSLRPQLTGGAWAAAQSARDYNANPSNRWKPKEGDGSSLNVPLASPTNSTIRGAGKDAFAELDEENRISTKSNQGSSSKVAPPLDFNSLNLASEEGLPNLPDAPKTEINIPEGTATFDSDLEVDERQNPVSIMSTAWRRREMEGGITEGDGSCQRRICIARSSLNSDTHLCVNASKQAGHLPPSDSEQLVSPTFSSPFLYSLISPYSLLCPLADSIFPRPSFISSKIPFTSFFRCHRFTRRLLPRRDRNQQSKSWWSGSNSSQSRLRIIF